MLKKIIVTLLLVTLMVSASFTVSASESFSKTDVPGNKTETRLSREMYSAVNSLNATSLGLSERLQGITDICSDENGNILLILPYHLFQHIHQ